MRIEIIANQLETFEERIAYLDKKLKREVIWAFAGFEKRKEKYKEKEVEVIYALIDVEIENLFSVDGFKFYAVVSFNQEGCPVIFSEDEKAFEVVDKLKDFKCPHCNKVIKNRKSKIYLKNEKSEIVAFGSSCAQKYFGSSYALLSKGLRYLKEFKESISSLALSYSGYSTAIDHENAVLGAIHLYKKGEKFLSREAAGEYGNPTSNKVHSLVNYVPSHEYKHSEYENYLAAVPSYADDVKAIREFYLALEIKNNFDSNLKDQFAHKGNKYGILVYGVYRYFWEKEKAEKKQTAKPYVASGLNVGDEVKDLEVFFLRKAGYDTRFGWKSFYTFLTKENSQIVISCMGDLDNVSDETLAGKVFTVKKAKVKEIKAWNNIPQTILKLGRKNALV